MCACAWDIAFLGSIVFAILMNELVSSDTFAVEFLRGVRPMTSPEARDFQGACRDIVTACELLLWLAVSRLSARAP